MTNDIMTYDPAIHTIVPGIAKLGDWYMSEFGTPHQTTLNGVGCTRMLILPRPLDLSFVLANAKPDKEWTYGNAGDKYRMHTDFLQFYTTDREWRPAFICRPVLNATDWRPVEPPKTMTPEAGTAEWFNALPVGTCCWEANRQSQYARRTDDGGYDWVNVLSGSSTHSGCSKFNGWSLCLHHGKPAEPVVESQFWGQVVCRYLEKAVTHNASKGTWQWDKAKEEFRYWCDGRDVERGYMLERAGSWHTGWSLCEQPEAEPAKPENEYVMPLTGLPRYEPRINLSDLDRHRDCEHGQQARVCEVCAIAARVQELEQMLNEYQHTISSDGSLTTHVEYMDILRDMAAAYKRDCEIDPSIPPGNMDLEITDLERLIATLCKELVETSKWRDLASSTGLKLSAQLVESQQKLREWQKWQDECLALASPGGDGSMEARIQNLVDRLADTKRQLDERDTAYNARIGIYDERIIELERQLAERDRVSHLLEVSLREKLCHKATDVANLEHQLACGSIRVDGERYTPDTVRNMLANLHTARAQLASNAKAFDALSKENWSLRGAIRAAKVVLRGTDASNLEELASAVWKRLVCVAAERDAALSKLAGAREAMKHVGLGITSEEVLRRCNIARDAMEDKP